jgi:putative transposase
MATNTKSKKRKKRYEGKKKSKNKRLTKIDTDIIKRSKLWRPNLEKFENSMDSNSFFKITSLNEKIKKSNVNKVDNKIQLCRKKRIYPTNSQKVILLQWFEIYRQVYNITVKYFRLNKKTSKDNFYKIRPIINNIIETDHKGLNEKFKKSGMPKHTRDNAINDCIKAYKTCFANLKNGNLSHFMIKYKKKSSFLKTLVLEPSSFSKKMNGFSSKTLGCMDCDGTLINSIKQETRLTYDTRNKKFILMIPYKKEIKVELNRNKVIAIDTGVSPFVMGYTPDGNNIIRIDAKEDIKKLIERKDNVKKYKNHNKFIRRINKKLYNKTRDLHFKLAHLLCTNFDNVLIGKLNVSNVISKKLNLNNPSKTILCAMSHFTFRTRLISTAKKYNCNIEVVNESYTSKTCGNCGYIKNDLGSNKVYKCDSCNYLIDRDVNGARNIMLKSIYYN